ncbi:MAG: signal recognition particle protein [Actinobacteria bacterium]|nr:signal recognition particle protein [Cyanobacteriota bacterium]MCL5772380.1 signal recognition particle protein [Actinomycetota bacterium]
MFEFLTSKFEDLFFKIKNKGKLSPKDLDDSLREIKLILLEADVNFVVVKEFLEKVKQKALGENILESLTPFQQVVKIVNDEMINMLGGSSSLINFSQRIPTIIMLVGLQGSGKTTASVKLAGLLKSKYARKVSLIAADIYRPAAILQLIDYSKKIGCEVYHEENTEDPVLISINGIDALRKTASDVVIIDTAGRLQIDTYMMNEIVEIKNKVKPHQIYLVVDSMSGQEAVNVAKEFNSKIEYDGIILTKLDSDSRGGAALSINHVIKKPIKFVSTGEKIEDFDIFYPDRMASRILGMGDILTLIEKTEKLIDEKKAKELEEKIYKSELNFEDFVDQLKSVKKLGSLEKIFSMLPIMGKNKALKDINLDDRQIDKIEAIINSMTIEERRNPELINGSRKKRIADGSGTTVNDVNKLLKQFENTRQLLKQFTGGFNKKGFKFPFPGF